MGYVSFSENKVSKLHVFEYILYLTLKGREPRIQDVRANHVDLMFVMYLIISSNRWSSWLDGSALLR